MRVNDRFGVLAVAVMTGVAAGCGTLRVSSYEWPGAEFGRYRTFAWAAQERLSTGDPRLDNNEIFRAGVRRAVERELAPRGLDRVEPEGADLLVHVHAHIDQRIESRNLERDIAVCAPGACGPYVWEAGTLLLDLVDRRTDAVVWRGWAEGSLDGAIDDQARLEQTVDDAVAKILARLPGGDRR
jgi:hypothetical protein